MRLIMASKRRRAASAGKRVRRGRLRITACQSSNQIVIEVSDDGRGIDAERLVARAIAAGIVTAERAERLSHEARLALAFEPGLSTARTVTALSGRGVGMDVVRANIERIGGVVDISSVAGKGVTLTLRMPLTLSIIPALAVGAGGHHFAVPRAAIRETCATTTLRSSSSESVDEQLFERLGHQVAL